MSKSAEELCNALGKFIVDRDFAGAYTLLAPWYRPALSAAEIERMVDAQNEGLEHPPHSWTVGEGMVGLEELRKPDPYGPPTKALPKQITDDNFRAWMQVQFAPDPSVHEVQNINYDVWVIVIENGGDFQIGYLEAGEAV